MPKRLLLIQLYLLASLALKAQIRDDPADAYSHLHVVGFNFGGTLIYGDLKHHPIRDGYSVTYGCNLSDKIRIGIEGAAGALYSDNPATEWTDGLNSNNNFKTANVNARYSFNNLFKKRGAKNKEIKNRLYWGLGVGYLSNNLSTLTTRLRPDQQPIKNTNTNSSTATLLENIGADLKLPKNKILPKTVLNINFQATYAFSDYVDGYSFTSAHNNFNDLYFMLTAGLHFYFGTRD
jgi:hypothetical protein